MTQRDEFLAEEVQKLKVKVDCANLILKEAAGDKIVVETEGMEKQDYKCTCEGGKLKIRQKMHGMHRSSKRLFSIILSIPAGKRFDKTSFVIGAGEADATQAALNTADLKIETGAGNIAMKELNVSQECYLEAGAGSVQIEKVYAQNMKVDCGAGKVEMRGKIENNLNADCGVGKIVIHLDGRETDYNFETSCGIGTIRINDSTTGRLGSERCWTNPEAVGTIRLDCGVGKIDLTTI